MFLDYDLIDQEEEIQDIQPRNLAEGNNYDHQIEKFS